MNKETVLNKDNVIVAAKEIIKLEKKHYYGEDNPRDRLKNIRTIIDSNYKKRVEK